MIIVVMVVTVESVVTTVIFTVENTFVIVHSRIKFLITSHFMYKLEVNLHI